MSFCFSTGGLGCLGCLGVSCADAALTRAKVSKAINAFFFIQLVLENYDAAPSIFHKHFKKTSLQMEERQG